MRRITILFTALLLALGMLAPPAAAEHIHAKELQNGKHAGSCVVLSLNGNERYIQNHRWPEGRPFHPLHMNFHVGQPVDQGGLVVHARDEVDFVQQGLCHALINVRE
jgi:hypothetical protein